MKLLNPITAGALCHSSKYLAEAIKKAVSQKYSGQKIIELGPGNGIFTHKLSHITTNITTVELDEKFEETLEKYSEVIIQDVFLYLKNKAYENNCLYVSGLPHIMFGKSRFQYLLELVRKNLQKDSYFILFTYWKWTINDWTKETDLFSVESSKYVFRNIPPAWVMTLKAK